MILEVVVQVPGKPLLITQEPPPEEDVGQLRDLQNSFKGGAFLGQQHLPLFTHLLFETMSAESASMKLWHLLFSSLRIACCRGRAGAHWAAGQEGQPCTGLPLHFHCAAKLRLHGGE